MGKTALAKKLLAAYPGDKRILDPSGNFTEEEGHEWPGRRNVNEWIDELTAEGGGPAKGGWGPGLLVLDDADRYLTATAADSFRDVWLANRHLGLDVIVTAHRPQGVPKDLLGSTEELWLFAQEEPRALDYLASIPALRFLATEGAELPTEPGYALRVKLRARAVELVDVFDR